VHTAHRSRGASYLRSATEGGAESPTLGDPCHIYFPSRPFGSRLARWYSESVSTAVDDGARAEMSTPSE
jgi:hypothetical protein